jgi:3'-5' exoribonuclease
MPQVKVEKIRPAMDGEYDPESFIPSTPKDIGILTKRVGELIESIKDPSLYKLGKLVFEDQQFMKDFNRSPGGVKWHHPYLGGLLEHSVRVAELCNFTAQEYPELNRDLLVLAALLHDLGKVKEYSATTIIDYTDEGRLEGHVIIGERFIRNMCERIESFPQKLKMLLSHLILSHQGHKEFSSPVEPMIPEAFVLYYADEIDAKLNALNRITETAKKDGGKWSEFIKLLGRYIFVDYDKDNMSVNE